MSEEQYYEFLAVDRTLTDHEIQHLRAISSRARITSSHFSNTYNWGDLGAEPRDLMQHFFDIHLYVAGWGDARLMLRLPPDVLDPATAMAYASPPWLDVQQLPEHWLLIWSPFDDEAEETGGDCDPDGLMVRLAPIRDELLRGDLRSLSLGWLAAVGAGAVNPDVLEPDGVDPGSPLTPAQCALAEFLLIDPDLLQAAGASLDAGTGPDVAADRHPDAWLEALPEREVRGYLQRILDGDGAAVERTLRQQHRAWQRAAEPAVQSKRRSVCDLWLAATEARNDRLRREALARQVAEAERQRERDARLAAMADDVGTVWQTIDAQAGTGHGRGYDAALQQLLDLKAAYARHRTEAAFDDALEQFMLAHGRRPALVNRLRTAGLWKR